MGGILPGIGILRVEVPCDAKRVLRLDSVGDVFLDR